MSSAAAAIGGVIGITIVATTPASIVINRSAFFKPVSNSWSYQNLVIFRRRSLRTSTTWLAEPLELVVPVIIENLRQEIPPDPPPLPVLFEVIETSGDMSAW